MPTFAFSARSSAGKPVKGRRMVSSEGALELELAGDGLFLIEAHPVTPAPQAKARVKLKDKDLATFLLHLASYLEVGLPLLIALKDYRDPERPRLEAAVMDMAERMAEGASLSAIMAAYPGLFQPMHVAMVRAGEATGRLDQAIRALIRLAEWEAGLRAQIRQAATYPLILLSLMSLIILLVCVYSLPPILKLLEDFHIALPLATRAFLGTGRWLKHYGWVLAVAPPALGYGIRLLLRRPDWRLRWDTAKLSLPVAGRLVTRLALSRFAHFFAGQYRAGIPMIQALRNSEEVTGNARLGHCIRLIRDGVEQGERLAAMAARVGYFPPLVIRLLIIGEETGHLDETLDKAAGYFDGEVAEGVRLAFQVLEPLIKVVLACLLVFVALAVLLPLYTLVGGINE